VGASYTDRLYLPASTVIHRLPGRIKLVAAFGFVVAVVSTPREQFWAFGVHAAVLASLALVARVPFPILIRRMSVEIPFLLFAVLMPFLTPGQRVEVLGVPMSADGLYDAWNVVVKATLGVATSIILAATTEVHDLVRGLGRLRMPALLVQIMSFMIRYGDLVLDETRRMRVARESRGFLARDVRHLPAVARSVGALFIRVYERGERVHLAMLSRGYPGQLPGVVTRKPSEPAMSASADPVPIRPPALEIEDLVYAYPDGHQALRGVNLTVRRGERLALLGPNGAGKTTVALHLNGVLTPVSGELRVSGLAVLPENLREIRRRVGIVFQDPDDQLFMPTVRDDVAFGPANFGLRGEDLDLRVDRALRAVGLSDLAHRAPHHLSFGQRRRAAVATVLAMDPEVLVLDEPSSNLDPASRRELAEILDPLDLTLVMVTHDLLYALQLCQRSVILSGGQIVADGPTRQVLADASLLARHRLELPYGFDHRLLESGAGSTGEIGTVKVGQ
jgi:cobalt/nickel transport system permease protein